VKGMDKTTIGTCKAIEENKVNENIDSINDIAILESNLDIILNQYKKSLSQIIDDKRYVKIAVAGRMNHGKSSLLNSLIGDNIFKVQDIRETTTNSRYELFEDVLLVDTPGLDANTNDDAIANVAYESSNIILFVHNYNVGDFHKGELEALKRIADFHNREAFSDRFILVLTGKDAVTDQNNRELIKLKLLKDIKEFCGLQNFPIFEVSNTTFMKGKSENKEKLITYSGIPILLEYITNKIEELKPLRTKQTIEKIRNIQSIAIHLFNEILQNKTINLDSELIDADKLYEEYKTVITKEINDLHSQYKYLKQEEEELNLFIDTNNDWPSKYIYYKYIAPEMGGSSFLACLSRSEALPSYLINIDEMRKDALSHYPSRVYLKSDFKDKEILILKTKMSAKKQEVEEIRNKFNSYHEYLYNKYIDDSIIKKSKFIVTKNRLLAENFLDILLEIEKYIYGDALKLQNEVEYIKPWILDVDNFSDMTIKLLEGLE
ncbi:GTPase, partial [Gemella sanguinis]|uniref:GTPase n=1 Tax=Gemella sanguinis TaxID=84135 RepID=UPI0026EEE59B